ncbi:MAG: hypothetical protein MUP76_04840 [Acidimicrobiia bacterium]|nr:hypothetical protein [Acidimicrobiia bacterium]
MKCRFKLGDLLRFIGMFSLFAVPAVVGVIAGGFGWSLLGWALFCLVFFELWEIRILCAHCPYYAERGTTLHCIANYGSLKVWKYRPGPMSLSEKTQLIVGFVILGGYPFPFLLLGDQYVWAVIALGGLTAFFWTLRRWTCSRCVNFSCPLNSVSKPVVDAYLERNPVMLKAWKESGYRLGPP